MNWIIKSTKIVKFHTNLYEVLQPIWENLIDYDWVLTDLDFIQNVWKVPINFDKDYFVLNHDEFKQLYKSKAQIIWGVISAIPKNALLDVTYISNISAEHENVWKPYQFLIEESFLEIIAFDSGYTILKFKDEKLSNIFKEYFQEQAIDLQKFNDKI